MNPTIRCVLSAEESWRTLRSLGRINKLMFMTILLLTLMLMLRMMPMMRAFCRGKLAHKVGKTREQRMRETTVLVKHGMLMFMMLLLLLLMMMMMRMMMGMMMMMTMMMGDDDDDDHDDDDDKDDDNDAGMSTWLTAFPPLSLER